MFPARNIGRTVEIAVFNLNIAAIIEFQDVAHPGMLFIHSAAVMRFAACSAHVVTVSADKNVFNRDVISISVDDVAVPALSKNGQI